MATSVFKASFLIWAGDSVPARAVATTLSIAYSDIFNVNSPDSILAMSSNGLDQVQQLAPPTRENDRIGSRSTHGGSHAATLRVPHNADRFATLPWADTATVLGDRHERPDKAEIVRC